MELKNAHFLWPVFLALAALALAGCAQTQSSEPYHVHADFKVFIEGKQFDFNRAAFMSTDAMPLSENVHLHDFNPNVIHFHGPDATLADFFTSIGMGLDENCFNDGLESHCNGNGKTLAMFVNGVPNSGFGNYKPKDLDKILISFGENPPSREMLDSVSNEACIYSEKCPAPEGFSVPDESCAGQEVCAPA